MKLKTKFVLLVAINITTLYVFKTDSNILVNNGVISTVPISILGMFGIILQMSIIFSGSCFSRDSSMSLYSFFRGKSLIGTLLMKYLKTILRVLLVILIISMSYNFLYDKQLTLKLGELIIKICCIGLSYLYYMLIEFMLDESRGFMFFNIIALISLVINLISLSFINVNLSFLWPTNLWYSDLNSGTSLFIAIILGAIVLLISSLIMKKKI